MSSVEVRPFRRSDREQVTALVNAHAGAVVPGLSVSASTVLSDRLHRVDYAWLQGTDPGGLDYAGYRALPHASLLTQTPAEIPSQEETTRWTARTWWPLPQFTRSEPATPDHWRVC